MTSDRIAELEQQVARLKADYRILQAHTWARADELSEQVVAAADKLTRIRDWCDAYPLTVFPEPNFERAAIVLEAHGMTIDAISASNMRHVLTGVRRIIDEEEP